MALVVIVKFVAISTHDLEIGGILGICNDMPGHFQRLNCEVDPEKGNSTDCSSFDENLKGVNFLHGITIQINV